MQENLYKAFTPKPKPLSDYGIEFEKILSEPAILAAIAKANENYLHWEDLRHKNWIPENFFPNKEVFWSVLRMFRLVGTTITPIRDANGCNFIMNTKSYNEFLHTIDKEMAGNFMSLPNFSENDKKQLVARNIIEEAVASSQLEGANTSRAAAKKMLLEGRKPHDNSEQMILNTHRTLLAIEQELYKEELSWELVCELHSMITYQTIAKDKQGKLRETFDKNGQRLTVRPWSDNTIAYITPDKEFVTTELPRLIKFANDKKADENGFIHPLLKAIMLHFWISLLHPFEDGNGRLARTLFYWYMLKHGYWTFKYLSLSEKIKKSSKQYAIAYIYSEQDCCDLTYFIHYNIEKLKLARKDFQEYLSSNLDENRKALRLNQSKHHFNERQIKLLAYFYQKMESRTNIAAYQQLYSVKKVTAISDLKMLVDKKFLIKKKQGRNTYYYPTKEIGKLF